MQYFYWILTVFIAMATAWWVYRADIKRNIPLPWLTAALRGIVIGLALLLILAPVVSVTKNEIQKPVILLLQDGSRSVAEALGADTPVYRKNVQQLIDKLSAKYRVVQWGFGSMVRTDSLFNYDFEATDIASALARVQDFYGNQNLGAVILATDGRYNQGADPLYEQYAFHNPVYTIAIGDSAQPKDLRIARTYINKTVALGSQFEIRADILASHCDGYSNDVSLREAGNTLSSLPVNITSGRYDRSVSFAVKADKAGLHHYIISAPPADGEKNTANNSRDVFVEVTDKKKNILILCAAPHPDVNAISDALTGVSTYKITIKTIDQAPASFDGYDAVILHELPSSLSSSHIITGKKPVWYILGNESNVNEFNKAQNALIAVPAVPQDAFSTYDPAFSAFILPKDVQTVIDKMPPLVSPVSTLQNTGGANTLFNNKNTHTPIWMLVQGTVPTAVLAGEGIWRWRLYEYKNFGKHDVVDECIRQTIAFLTANTDESAFRVEMPKYVWSDREPISVNARLLNANNEQVNTPDAEWLLTDSAGNKQNYSFERSGTTYRLNVGIRAAGVYSFKGKTIYNGNTYTSTGSFVVQGMSLELMETGVDYAMLYALSKKYGGYTFPATGMSALADSIEHNETIKPVIQTNTESVPLIDRKWFFFLILMFITAEWLLRKYWLAQ